MCLIKGGFNPIYNFQDVDDLYDKVLAKGFAPLLS
jgi:hypothetical protein